MLRLLLCQFWTACVIRRCLFSGTIVLSGRMFICQKPSLRCLFRFYANVLMPQKSKCRADSFLFSLRGGLSCNLGIG